MSDAVEDVLASVTDMVEPSLEEREAVELAVAELTERTISAAEELAPGADVMHVGSTARDTWLAGERDIDVFVRFPPETDRETLRERGLAVGRAVLPDGEATYAEHPYITGRHDGFDVDVVPCVRVASADAAETAVDRTPFHTRYVADRLDEELAREVRLAKAFCRGIAAYGSDLTTRGFGGYLLELLILEFGDLRSLLERAADWRPPVVIDPAGHAAVEFEADLVVVDPTDPSRNVAAVVSRTNLSRLQHYARRFLAEPDTSFFEPPTPGSLSEADLEAALDDRGTTVLALRFDRPDVLDDQLYPQLRKTRTSLVEVLDRTGFDVLRSAVLADDDVAAILLEPEVAERAAVERHHGPPVQLRDHADRFLASYDDADVYGPFIADDRYVVEKARDFTAPAEVLESDRVFDLALGEHVADELEAGYEVLANEAISGLLPRFDAELAAYFDPRP